MARNPTRALLVLLTLLVFCDVLTGGMRIARPTWSYCSSKKPLGPFLMETLAVKDHRLIGTAEYRNSEIQRANPVTFQGVINHDDKFWPKVTAEVASDPNGKWKAINTPDIAGNSGTLVVKPGCPNVMLYIDLEPFRPFIGKMQCGRVVLSNGQSATFELKDIEWLISAGTAGADINVGVSDDWSNDLIPFGAGPSEPYIKRPVVIDNISQKAGRIVGSCVYVARKDDPSLVVDGKKTSDGRLWLSASAQVANDYQGVWMDVGKCENPGKAAKIGLDQLYATAKGNRASSRLGYFVDLTVFKPWAGKYRYGRIVMSNGQSAAFELKELVSPIVIDTSVNHSQKNK